jgi:UDP-2,4-diacetamido-2,4,6-trideoxy-beta-L-altropyranose hydrolase
MQPMLIRANGGEAIGAGHLMRCLGLAQAWQDAGGQAQFAMSGHVPAIEARLARERIACSQVAARSGSPQDAAETAALAMEAGAAWVVADSYDFDGAYQDGLRQAGRRVLFLDDYGHAGRYSAEFILNPNLHAEPCLYNARAGCSRLLLGPRFALLRREFRSRPSRRRPAPQLGRRILVTMGGSDPANATARALEAIRLIQRRDLQVAIVLGPASPHYDAVSRAAASAPFAIGIERNPQALRDFMAWADVAVSAGGGTCWELAFMGVPQMVLTIAPNQVPVAAGLERYGLAVLLGQHGEVSAQEMGESLASLLADANLRSQLAERGQEAVDGQGAMRVAVELMEYGGAW